MKRQALLYDKPECPFCWRVRMAMHRCGIEVERRDYEAHAEEWKTLTKAGTVPVLQVDELVLTDSSVMLEYLNDTYGGLWPASARHAARARALALEVDRSVGAAVRDLVFQCRGRAPETWDRAAIDRAIGDWRASLPGLATALGGEEFFVEGSGITDFVLATRFGLGMAYGMPAPDAPVLNAWYKKIVQRPEFIATAPPSVTKAVAGGWQS